VYKGKGFFFFSKISSFLLVLVGQGRHDLRHRPEGMFAGGGGAKIIVTPLLGQRDGRIAVSLNAPPLRRKIIKHSCLPRRDERREAAA